MRKLFIIAFLLVTSISLVYGGYGYYQARDDEKKAELTPTWSPDEAEQDISPASVVTPDLSEYLVCQEASIRLNSGQNEPIVGSLAVGERIFIRSATDDAVQIETQTGVIGWVDKHLVDESCN